MRGEMQASAGAIGLAHLISREEEGLLACVHCGFCLTACPTYARLGDENDSPRGRLYLMKAVVEGRIETSSEAFQTHIDRCLGCRACEPVCPSGVPYGRLMELARAEATRARRRPLLVRALLMVFGSKAFTRIAMAFGRLLRSGGSAGAAARALPGPLRRIRFGLAMLAASAPGSWRRRITIEARKKRRDSPGPGSSRGVSSPVTACLEGCVQAGLFAHVNGATERVLGANGVTVVEAPGQVCCGALHAHGGDLDTARALARRNVDAFASAGVETVVVNASGCGAAMKEYGHLLADDPDYAERATKVAAAVRDVSEVLAARGPRAGAPLPLRVTWDAPCHLLHAQRVAEPPNAVLAAIPGLELVELDDAAECCGGAGIYGLTHPELGGWIGGDKVDAVVRTGAAVVATGNPGCIMQIGAGLKLRGSEAEAVHPVELLDASYRQAGFYRRRDADSAATSES